MHPRVEIRNRIKELLIEADTIAEGRVFKNRKHDVLDDECPCILVFDNVEKADPDRPDEEARRARFRRVSLNLDLWISAVASEADPDDRLDAFCEAVEAVMDANEYLAIDSSRKPTHHEYQATLKHRGEGSKSLLAAQINYLVTYLG